MNPHDTTPTPAQQLEPLPNRIWIEVWPRIANILCNGGWNVGGEEDFDDEVSRAVLVALQSSPIFTRALAALEAVEGGVRAEFSVLDNDRGWLIDGADNDAQAARLDALSKLHAPVLIIPADAVEVSRGE